MGMQLVALKYNEDGGSDGSAGVPAVAGLAFVYGESF